MSYSYWNNICTPHAHLVLRSASSAIKKLATKTNIWPKLGYASSIWHPVQVYLTYELESIQNCAAHFIMSSYSHKTSITELKQTLNRPSLDSRRIILHLCMLHSFYYHSIARHPRLQPPPRISLCLNHSSPVAHIHCCTSAMKDSFFPNAITLLNSLLDNIVLTTNHELFHEKLTIHLS